MDDDVINWVRRNGRSQWKGQWEDVQLSFGELDFKVPVGLLSLDVQQVLGYMSLQLKAKGQRHRLRRVQHGHGNEFKSRLWGALGVTAVLRVPFGPADIPFLVLLLPLTIPSPNALQAPLPPPLKCGDLR